MLKVIDGAIHHRPKGRCPLALFIVEEKRKCKKNNKKGLYSGEDNRKENSIKNSL